MEGVTNPQDAGSLDESLCSQHGCHALELLETASEHASQESITFLRSYSTSQAFDSLVTSTTMQTNCYHAYPLASSFLWSLSPHIFQAGRCFLIEISK